MHVVEVDQSGRIDQTDRPTVLAFANGCAYSIYVSAEAKRECLKALRKRQAKSNKSLYILLFATLLYLLLKDHTEKLDHIVIDTEYEGHEPRIKQHTLNLLRRAGKKMHADQIEFRQVGKKSPAHLLGWRVYTRKVIADYQVRVTDIMAEFRQ